MHQCLYAPERLLSAPKEVVVREQRLHPLVIVLGGRGHDRDGRDLLAAKDLVVQILSRLQEQTLTLGCFRCNTYASSVVHWDFGTGKPGILV